MISDSYAGKEYLRATFYIYQLLPILLPFLYFFGFLTLYKFLIVEVTTIGFLFTSNAINSYLEDRGVS